jgi:hypothetical protein
MHFPHQIHYNIIAEITNAGDASELELHRQCQLTVY